MPVRASIEPLLWENTFFGVNSGIVRIDASAPELTPEELQAWQRVQVKVPAENIAWLSALQSLGFSLVEGEVDFALPVKGIATSMARKLQTLKTFLLCVSWPERRLRRVVFARRGMRPTPASVFTPSGLRMRYAARLITNAWCFARRQALSAVTSRCGN